MRNVLVTGADGFIGSHLVELLLSKNLRVKALSLYNSFNNWGHLEEVEKKPNLEIVCGDVRDPAFCLDIMKEIDTVFHLAALIAIPYSYKAPDSYVDTNIRGTMNICNAAKVHGVKKIIHTSTSEVYGSAQYVPIDEKHPLVPQSPYSASKIAADAMALSYFYAFEMPVTVARPFNTYGPRQSARAVIPTIITQIAAGKKEIKLGDLTPKRDFNFVKDTCHGFYSIAMAENVAGETINIGSQQEISVGELANLIKEMMGSDIKIVEDEIRNRPAKSEVNRLLCDNQKIKHLTGYVPQFDLKTGLRKTIDWFQNTENLKHYKIEIYNV